MTLLQAAPTYRDGLHLPGTPVWLDPVRPQSISFVSHTRHIRPRYYRKALASNETGTLVRARAPYERKFNPLTLPFGQFFSLGNLSLELIPSGMGMGGAQLKIASNGYTTLYSRDIATEKGVYTSSAMPTRANRLILGTDGACPENDYLSRADAATMILDQITEEKMKGHGIRILVPEVGEAQELSSILNEAGLQHAVDDRIARINDALVELGFKVPAPPRKTTLKPGEVLLCSEHHPQDNFSQGEAVFQLDSADGKHWRIDNERKKLRFTALASEEQLIAFVEAIDPGEVLTTGHHRESIAKVLRDKGWNAETIRQDQQLPLHI